MIIKILGSGCKKCVARGENARVAAATAGKQAEIVRLSPAVPLQGSLRRRA